MLRDFGIAHPVLRPGGFDTLEIGIIGHARQFGQSRDEPAAESFHGCNDEAIINIHVGFIVFAFGLIVKGQAG